MKKRLLIGKIIGFVGICLFAMGISYLVTYYLEKESFQDIKLLITFEDTKTFELENTNKLEKEAALKTYPYIFTIENQGKTTDYTITLEDVEIKNLSRQNLNYILLEDDKEVKEGLLSELEDDVLYQSSILKNKEKNYKLYIYLNEELESINYEYKIMINSSK